MNVVVLLVLIVLRVLNYWNRDKFDQFGDAHLIHDEILQEHNWKIFNKLLKTLFNETLLNLFNDYYQQYMITNKIPSNKKTLRRFFFIVYVILFLFDLFYFLKNFSYNFV